MCRSIRPLRVAEPPTTDGDVRAAALQYVRKVSGSRTPPRRDAAAFEAAIDDVAAATTRLLAALGTLARLRRGDAARALAAIGPLRAERPPERPA